MPKRSRTDSGSILFEFAIVVPVFLLLVLGGLDLLLATTAKSNLSYVAQETAACGARTPAKCSDLSAYANNIARGIGLQQTVSLSQNACSGNCVSVTAQVTTQPAGPFFPSISLVSTARATGGGGAGGGE